MDDQIRKKLMEMLEKGEKIPEEYETEIFPTSKKEYELKYADKEREQVILNDTMSVPFQAIKHFGEAKESEWSNMLIFGDNLQALKHLIKLKNEGKLRNPDGTDGVKLVYIDPPFASRQDFEGAQDQKAYHDKLAGADFIEFIRKRLILLRELMSDDGSIYVHLDYRKSHYIKVILDEMFGESNFINHLIWCFAGGAVPEYAYPRKHADIFLYVKRCKSGKPNTAQIFNQQMRKYSQTGSGRRSSGEIYDLNAETPLNDWWTDIPPQNTQAIDDTGYPTQKPEKLLERIIRTSSNKGDIIIDCFAGSGTTGAVAEKLGCKWIMCDCGKLSIYTIQKRMMELKKEIGNRGNSLKPKPFTLYHAGLYYDGKMLNNMQTDDYRDFVLELFGCQKREHKINGIQMHGTLNNYSVMLFDKENYLTHEFIDDLHTHVGSVIKDQMYMIAPVGVVGFAEDYVKRGNNRYVVLRIPNSLIEYIRDKNFTKLSQPRSALDINQTIDAVGFDFVYPPKLKARYYTEKPSDKLIDKQYVIEIQEFEPIQIGTNIKEFKDPKAEALAMIMVDLDYNGETFNLSKYFFGDEIVKNKFKATWSEEIGNKIMIIYLDIFGNEQKEVIDEKEFKRR